MVFYELCFPYSGYTQTSDSTLPMPVVDDQVTDSANHNVSMQVLESEYGNNIPTPSSAIHTTSQQLHQQQSPSTNHIEQPKRPTDHAEQPRRSTRHHKAPSNFQDYICSNISTIWCDMVTILSP